MLKNYAINNDIENENDRRKYIGKSFNNKTFGEYEIIGVYDTNGSKTGNKRYVIEFKDTGYQTVALSHHILNGGVKDFLKPIIYDKGYYGYVKNIKHNPYLNKWMSMLQRCYDEKLHSKEETYKDCIVDDRWLCFELFLQDIPNILGYQEMIGHQDILFEIDKDILTDSKIYNLENCIFIPGKLNNFFTNIQKHNTSGYPGVSYSESKQKYICYVNNDSKRIWLGHYDNPLDAFIKYQKHKESVLEEYLLEYDFLDNKIKMGCRDKLERQYKNIMNTNIVG